jgi:hypothetical protein
MNRNPFSLVLLDLLAHIPRIVVGKLESFFALGFVEPFGTVGKVFLADFFSQRERISLFLWSSAALLLGRGRTCAY